jgi:hypothetical protein
MLAGFGLIVWVPMLISKPQSHNNWSEFTLNTLIMSAAWLTITAVRKTSARTAA